MSPPLRPRSFLRFNHIVHTTPGSEEQKVAAARAIYSNAYGINVGALFNAMNKGGGVGGVLGVIFWFSLSTTCYAIPAYLFVNSSVSANYYAQLPYNQLHSLFYVQRQRGMNSVISYYTCPSPRCNSRHNTSYQKK